jgi:hypothetical protein
MLRRLFNWLTKPTPHYGFDGQPIVVHPEGFERKK